MSPILVRPIREQLEHDRIIRLLQLRSRRRYDAGMNPGGEQNVPVGTGVSALYPDLVLQSIDGRHRLQAVVEVETGESVNRLEALAQWSHLAKLRAAFHLYVPSSMVDVARRLCEVHQIHVAELWSYLVVGDEPRFALVHRSRDVPAAPRVRPARPVKAAVRTTAPARGSKAPRPRKSARTAQPARSAGSTAKRVAKPARPAKPARKQRK